MSAQLNWGAVYEGSFRLADRFFPKPNRRLFVVRNDHVEFPARGVVIMPFSGISEVGWLNTEPIQLRIELDASLVSADGVKFTCEIDCELILKQDHEAWRTVVAGRQTIYNRLKLLLRRCAESEFRRQEYAALYEHDAAACDALSAAVSAALAAQSPYTLELCVFEVEAEDERIDRELGSVRADILSARERGKTAQFDRERVSRRQALEMDEVGHQSAIRERQAEADIVIHQKASNEELRVERERRAAYQDSLKVMSDIFPDEVRMLAFTHPEIYTRLGAAKIEQYVEVMKLAQGLQMEAARQSGSTETFERLLSQIAIILDPTDKWRDSKTE